MTADPARPPPDHRLRELEAIWATPQGWRRLSAVNHSILGTRFMLTAFAFFLVGGVLAMLIRAQLATPDGAFMDADAYAQVFTMHGTVMMFLFAIPVIEGFAIYMLPKMLGSRDLAFPRLGAFAYWCYLFGGLIVVGSLLVGRAPDAGWFLYTPLSSSTYTPGINSDVWLIGVTFVEVSAVAAGVEFMATILKVRTAGMSLSRMPLMAWYLWVTAAMMVFGFPPLILGSILLEIERAFGWPFFDPARGGDPLLWQHLFWLFGHPEVYIIFLPAAGLVSTILPVLAGRPIVGYTWIVVSIVALGFVSFGLWVHHMFTVGIPHLALAFFSAASLLVVLPTSVQFFAWLATLLKGRPRMRLPMLFVYGFFFTFVIGGLTGVMVAVIPFDWQVHDTHFVVAHFHYVLIGGQIFPALAAAYYWLPHFTGRAVTETVGRVVFWVILAGFTLTFLPMHLTGLLGMPRRFHTYPEGLGWEGLNLVSSIGGFILAIGFALFIIDMLLQIHTARRKIRDPWGSGDLEWAMDLPPPSYNIASLPLVHGRTPLHQTPALAADLRAGRGLLAVPRHGWRETLAVGILDGRPEQIILLSGPTWIPLWTALAAAVFFGGLLAKTYVVSLLGLAAVVACALVWLWRSGLKDDPAEMDVGCGFTAIPHPAAVMPPSLWGLVFLLASNATLFASLLFGALFLWTVAPGWPPPRVIAPGMVEMAVALGGLVLGLGGALAALAAGRRGAGGARQLALAGAALGGAVAAAGFGMAALRLGAMTAEHAYAAVLAFAAAYMAFHAVLGVIFAAFTFARGATGWLSARRLVEVRATVLWWGYTAGAGVVTLLLLILMPQGVGG
ncbi:cytochrome c oxidase subunit I [Novispirillum sp. DQ9]|uniref:cytochrome c oxidase subunit I n=1 Tax=Novispirillum sp. DQ9 TaxID=3398612 RepID=UPI003C7A2F9A